jgi:hypothetical protein
VPYIKSVAAGYAFEDRRAQGYTVAVFTGLESFEDMVYYDEECEAHAALKQIAKSIHVVL